MINYIVVTRPVAKPEAVQTQIPEAVQNTVETIEYSPSSYNYSDLESYGLPSYYFNPMGLLMNVFFSFLWVLILAVMLQVVIWGVISVYFLIKPKEVKCPNCGKKIRCKKSKPKQCLFCGSPLEKEIAKPH